MNDPRTAAQVLWSRLISGETLDEVDLQKLNDLVQQDSSLRDEIEADASLHALLRSITDVMQTEDQFVGSVLERCSALDADIQPKEENARTEHELAPYPRAANPTDEVPETTSENGTSTPLAADRHTRMASTYRKRRQPSAWAATALTVVVFACLGLVVWIQLGPSSSQTGSKTSESVAQETTGSTNRDVSSTNEDPPPSHPIVSTPGNETQLTPDASELPEPTLVETPQMGPHVQNETLANSDSQSPFVTLTQIQDPVWEKENAVGDRLGDEIVRLFAGSVELTFDDGAVVTVEGPVEFRPLSSSQLELTRGRLLASVPQKAIGFTVSTPTSNVVDLGTEFEVAVNEAGESDVKVHQGEVEVASIAPNGDEYQKWRLIPNKFDRASFYARPRIRGATPIAAALRGPRNQFQGFVSIDGQTAEFSSPQAFDNVRRRAEIELARSQENALRQWKAFVGSMQKNMQGTMDLNGQKMRFGSLQDVMRMQQQMLENVQKAGNNPSKSSFNGSINVNGKIITFKTREEYEAARQAAFGPAATFGIGDVFGETPSR